MSKRIGIDLDSTLVEYDIPYWTVLSQHFYESEGIPPKEFGLDKYNESERDFLKRLFRSPWYMTRVHAVPFAQCFLSWATESFDDAYIITAREGKVMELTEGIIRTQFDKQTAEKCKYVHVKIGESKIELIKSLGINMWVDDNPNDCKGSAELGVRTYMVVRPWNLNLPKTNGIVKIDKLIDIIDIERGGSPDGSKEQEQRKCI